jgi:hypothetical protein
MQLELPLFVIDESVQPNKKTISKSKSNICDSNSPMPKLSKTSIVDLTSKEKVFAPYWIDLWEEISSKLLLPVGIELKAHLINLITVEITFSILFELKVILSKSRAFIRHPSVKDECPRDS